MKRLVLVLASVSLALVFCEGVLRVLSIPYELSLPQVFEIDGYRTSSQHLYEDGGSLPWRMRANYSHYVSNTRRSPLPVLYETNSSGYRGESNCSQGDSPEFLFIGDSTTFGATVGQNETIPAYFSQLADACVYNGGVSGYGPYSYLLVLRELLAELPDIRRVFVGFYVSNDYQNLKDAFIEFDKKKEIRSILRPDNYVFPRGYSASSWFHVTERARRSHVMAAVHQRLAGLGPANETDFRSLLYVQNAHSYYVSGVGSAARAVAQEDLALMEKHLGAVLQSDCVSEESRIGTTTVSEMIGHRQIDKARREFLPIAKRLIGEDCMPVEESTKLNAVSELSSLLSTNMTNRTTDKEHIEGYWGYLRILLASLIDYRGATAQRSIETLAGIIQRKPESIPELREVFREVQDVIDINTRVVMSEHGLTQFSQEEGLRYFFQEIERVVASGVDVTIGAWSSERNVRYRNAEGCRGLEQFLSVDTECVDIDAHVTAHYDEKSRSLYRDTSHFSPIGNSLVAGAYFRSLADVHRMPSVLE
jgi:hypothetical protein